MTTEDDDLFFQELYGKTESQNQVKEIVKPEIKQEPQDYLQETDIKEEQPLILSNVENEENEEMKYEENYPEDEEGEEEVKLVYNLQETPKVNTHIAIAPTKIETNTVNYEETNQDKQFQGENYKPMFQFGPVIDVTAFQTDIDHLDEKPWRKPGAIISDYFNYGFNEETWRMYCAKQGLLKEEYKSKKTHEEPKKIEEKKYDEYEDERRHEDRRRYEEERRREESPTDYKYRDSKFRDKTTEDTKSRDSRNYEERKYEDRNKYYDDRKYYDKGYDSKYSSDKRSRSSSSKRDERDLKKPK